MTLPTNLRRITAEDAQEVLLQGLPTDWTTTVVTSAGADVALLISARAAYLATLGRGLTERRLSPVNAAQALVGDLVPLLRLGDTYITCTGVQLAGRRPAALVPLRTARLLHPVNGTTTQENTDSTTDRS